jgi:branched-subunit amino acid transport protein
MIDPVALWTVIILLGVGSFALRFVFLGLIGDRPLPPWVLRHLRYTAVAVLPGLVAPLVIWPEATGGALDAPRMAAAVVTLGAGLLTRNVLLSICLGAATLYGGLYLLG